MAFEGIGKTDDTLPASLGGMSLSDLLTQFQNQGGPSGGGGQGGEGAGPNPSGGQLGSAGASSGLLSTENLERSAISSLIGAMPGASALSPATSLFGLVGLAAQQGLLGPNLQGNQNPNINTNPAAYVDFAQENPGWLDAASTTIGSAISGTQSQRGLSNDPNIGLQGPAGLGGEIGANVGGVAAGGAIGAAGGAGEEGVLGGGGVSIGGGGQAGTGTGGSEAGSGSGGISGGSEGAGFGGVMDKGGIVPKTGKIDAQKGEGVLSKEAMGLLGEDAVHLINGIANSNASRLFKMMALHKALTVRQ